MIPIVHAFLSSVTFGFLSRLLHNSFGNGQMLMMVFLNMEWRSMEQDFVR